MFIKTDALSLGLTDDLTRIGNVSLYGRKMAGNSAPLFSVRLRDENGAPVIFDAAGADVSAEYGANAAVLTYRFDSLTVTVTLRGGDRIVWNLAVKNNSDLAVEYIDFPSLSVEGKLRRNGGDGAVVSMYNEGLLVEDGRLKTGMTDPEFPSQGGYMMFPYMVSAQFMLYLSGRAGLYLGVHDASRAPKGLDFKCSDEGTDFRVRMFMGGEFGGNVKTPDVVWKGFEGGWQDGADIYREWLGRSFKTKPISETDLPDWYRNDMPLVLTYPVRGIHDMDKMDPNRLFPYENVLPLVDEFAKRTNSRVMVLLMHWEGTAPWAPPFVWPPYGGADMFDEFMKKLHESGNLLGVYCSGLGFTEQSNLIASYNNEKLIADRNLKKGFCAAPDQSVPHSRICTGQRSGYDVCPASETGREILDEALDPLLRSGVDYIQALDQNHGGGMYFCYSKEHGHPPVPGGWMTKASKELLDGWKEKCPETLLGCESAAAEPYIEELRLSDNRYELCYTYGRPIPVYAYLYHPYLKNFMGNQVSCPLAYSTELCELRLAYSFLAGDLLTLVLNDEGEIMFHWGMRDFSKTPDRDELIGFIASLQSWHRVYPDIFRDALMVKPLGFDCEETVLEKRWGESVCESKVLTTAWKHGDKTVQFLVNWTHEPQTIHLENRPGMTLTRGGKTESFDGKLTLGALESVAVKF